MISLGLASLGSASLGSARARSFGDSAGATVDMGEGASASGVG